MNAGSARVTTIQRRVTVSSRTGSDGY